jgi:hypothetical protein
MKESTNPKTEMRQKFDSADHEIQKINKLKKISLQKEL